MFVQEHAMTETRNTSERCQKRLMNPKPSVTKPHVLFCLSLLPFRHCVLLCWIILGSFGYWEKQVAIKIREGIMGMVSTMAPSHHPQNQIIFHLLVIFYIRYFSVVFSSRSSAWRNSIWFVFVMASANTGKHVSLG